MILEHLRNVDGCPERGVTVTVMAFLWNAMRMFGAAAGPRPQQGRVDKVL
jgi:hypothetical protein